MPTYVEWYAGRAAVVAFLSSAVFGGPSPRRLRLAPAWANRQPAAAVYELDADRGVYRAFAIQVLRLDDGRIAEIAGFVDPGLFPFFGLAPTRDA